MDKKKNTKKLSFVAQGAIENYTFIACYLIGMLRMILLLNKISDEGIANYAYAFECYNILYIICSLALSQTLSRMVNARQSKGQYKNRNKLYKYVLFRSIIVSTVIGLICFLASNTLAVKVFGETNVSLAFKCLGISLIPAAFLTVTGHYLKGMGMKMPSCIAQILEQLVNLIVTILAGGALFRYGSKVSALLGDETKKSAFGAAAGAIGVFAGAVAGVLFLLVLLFLFRHMIRKESLSDMTKTVEHYNEIAINVELTSVFSLLSLLFTNLAVFVNQILYFHFAKGKSALLASNYGVFYGKVRLFLFLPLMLAFFMGNVLSGQLRRILKKDDINHARQRIGQSLKELLCLLLPSAMFLGVLAEPLYQLLYKGQNVIAVTMTHFAVIYIVLYGIALLTKAILLGMDKKVNLLMSQGVGCLVEILSFAFFFINSKTPIYGIVYAMIAGAIVQIILDAVVIIPKLRYRQEWFKTFLIPLGATAIIGIVDYLINHFLSGALGELFTLLICAVISCLIYMLIMITTGALKEYELIELPFGQYWVQLGKLLGILK